ncbi:phage major capsid protein [Arthrobacter agilis]|uniref:phage major capsid protein n=1 Tax=Arthrobacter agilis TaxID=37921 RepID=UPI000B35B0B6|nr:phage major capsid protein [Arthrobacter agilis]OUM45700.1 phage major capsid protein [Arthrobacter agilis]PPB47826.1 phage major capsid protein [Arthrobacter agilis]TPV21357.1 phage major capsid protein [Arthrobacter agilis]VDR32697.1 Predicted phage phi-C31 gp36 major capsid-like protein [Arthrobacter agilis]
MTLLSAAAGGILPPEYSELITKPITEQALAFQLALATAVTTGASTLNIPIVEEDAGASWVAEGAEISPDDPVLGELPITPAKVAGLTIISRELARDSSPDAQRIVGDGLARSIIAQVNAAWLGNLASPAPKGLASLTDTATVAGDLTNLDAFAEAVAAAEGEGANITGWVLSPVDALAVAVLKTATGSNQALTNDPRVLQGRPVFVDAKVPTGTAWGLDSSTAITVLREDVEIAVSEDAFFSSDRVAIRATARIGFGFPRSSTVVKLSFV